MSGACFNSSNAHATCNSFSVRWRLGGPLAGRPWVGHVGPGGTPSRAQADRSERRLPVQCTHHARRCGGAAARAAARASSWAACAKSFAGPGPPSSRLTLATWAFFFRTAARIREALRSSSTRSRLKGYVGGKPKRAGNNKFVLCTWPDLPSLSEVCAACPGRAAEWPVALGRRKHVRASTQKKLCTQACAHTT